MNTSCGSGIRENIIKTGLSEAISVLLLISLFSTTTQAFHYPEADNRKDTASGRLAIPEIGSEQKAWTRWWWMGNAVTRTGITSHLEKMAEANFGGVEISPIYGVEGYENASIAYLSEEWMDLLVHTVDEAERLGLQVDMILGTGWPYGGPHVDTQDAARRLAVRAYQLEGGQSLEQRIMQVNRRNVAVAPLHVLMGYSSGGASVDLTGYVDENGYLDWVPDENSGRWQLIAFFNDWTNQQVKRAAPGEDGHVMDHFSDIALSGYLERFESAFEGTEHGMIRSFFSDSYEVEGANWTYDFFDQFEKYRGYDLKDHLPAFLGLEGADQAGSNQAVSFREKKQRIRADFHATLHDLALNRFAEPWVDWSHARGSMARLQAHGFPANILDIYAAADIPEMEIFGQARFRIPGLRTNPDVSHRVDSPNPLILKFASSAANVRGGHLASSETATWLDEHFMVSLSQLRPHVDMQFVAGINHIIYHGTPYSPPQEKWPGWKFYASTHFAPSNTFWNELGDFNRYLANSQAFLQNGSPGNDVLLYFPVHELWHDDRGDAASPCFIRVHNPDDWFYGTRFGDTAELLWDRGYTFDYVSDRQLRGIQIEKEWLKTGNARYRVVVVPQTTHIPLETASRLYDIAEEGGTVIFKGTLPQTVPGYHNLGEREQQLDDLFGKLEFTPVDGDVDGHGFLIAEAGDGQILTGENTGYMLDYAGIQREAFVEEGLDFTRRRHKDGYTYFISNLQGASLDSWVPLATETSEAWLYDPLTGQSGRARLWDNPEGNPEVYLQLKPGESRVLRTFRSTDGKNDAGSRSRAWEYFQPAGKPVPVEGTWQVRFEKGGPAIPDDFETEELISWTETGDPEAKRFAGSAVYSITFQHPGMDADAWRLNLGNVAESAGIYLNGETMGSVWSHPFEIDIDSEKLHAGENVLEIRVTNLMINRIIDMDRHGIEWKKFYDINMVDINYQPFDASGWKPMESGLMGPVNLTPLMNYLLRR